MGFANHIASSGSKLKNSIGRTADSARMTGGSEPTQLVEPYSLHRDSCSKGPVLDKNCNASRGVFLGWQGRKKNAAPMLSARTARAHE
jgi:hypothetical protein